ncbi:MAG: efflux RND transporter periplasmic adaptor subunit [Carboxylicivirga sp.]|jgi:membrane fusion protein (multidrug efflux system)|nr:efflux RND transporter periplasmic adaptor subunit [Carboxylicivirga sp.]
MNRITGLIFLSLYLLTINGCSKKVDDNKEEANYKLIKLKERTSISLLSFPASIKGKQDIAIVSQVSGYITKVAVREGQKVKKNDVLFIIDRSPYQATFDAAQAKVAVEEGNVANVLLSYNNTLKLSEKAIVSEIELQDKKNQLMSAKAQLKLAQSELKLAGVNLNFTIIKSPSDGVVGKLPYREGAFVSPMMHENLTMISDNSEMFVYFSVSENKIQSQIKKYGDLNGVLRNMPALALQLNNGDLYAYKGRVESISGVIEKHTGAVSVRAVFPNPDQLLMSGGVGNVLVFEEYKDVIVIPRAATYELQDKICVFKEEKMLAKSKIIEVKATQNDQEYIVSKGLVAGDKIIAEGAGLLKENTSLARYELIEQ